MKEKKKRHPAWRMLVAACLLIGGGQGILVNCVGIFLTPIAEANGFLVGSLALYRSIGAVFMIFTMALSGNVIKKLPLRPLLLVTSILSVLLWTSYSQYTHLWQFYVVSSIYSILMVIPFYIVGPTLITNWFVKKQGLAMGIMMAVSSVCAVIFNIVGGIVIESSGYQMAFYVMGACALIMEVSGAMLAVLHPAMMGVTALGAEESEVEVVEDLKDIEEPGVKDTVALKSPAFYLAYLSIFFMIYLGCFGTMLPTYGVSLGYSISFSSALSSIFMVGSLAGSFIIGGLNDKIGAKKTTVLACGLMAIGAVGCAFTGQILPAMILFVLIMGLCAISGGTQPAILPRALFGKKDYASLYGKFQSAAALSAIVDLPLYGYIYDFTGSLSLALVAGAILCVLSIVLIMIAFKVASKLWDGVEEKVKVDPVQ